MENKIKTHFLIYKKYPWYITIKTSFNKVRLK